MSAPLPDQPLLPPDLSETARLRILWSVTDARRDIGTAVFYLTNCLALVPEARPAFAGLLAHLKTAEPLFSAIEQQVMRPPLPPLERPDGTLL